jgi:hypothetical protein
MGTPHGIILNVLWVWVVSYHFHVAVYQNPPNFRPLSAFPAMLENRFPLCQKTFESVEKLGPGPSFLLVTRILCAKQKQEECHR